MGRGPSKTGQYILAELEHRLCADLRDLFPEGASSSDYQNLRKSAVVLASAGRIELRKVYVGPRKDWRVIVALPGHMSKAE